MKVSEQYPDPVPHTLYQHHRLYWYCVKRAVDTWKQFDGAPVEWVKIEADRLLAIAERDGLGVPESKDDVSEADKEKLEQFKGFVVETWDAVKLTQRLVIARREFKGQQFYSARGSVVNQAIRAIHEDDDRGRYTKWKSSIENWHEEKLIAEKDYANLCNELQLWRDRQKGGAE